MKGKNTIMAAIKRAVSPLQQASAAPSQSTPVQLTLPTATPFTEFVLRQLDDEESRMMAMTFAPQIKMDCDARSINFDDCYHLLGHTEKRTAVRTLKRVIPEEELVLRTSVQNSPGRPRDVYMLSVNEFEGVLLEAKTEAGKRWRKFVLKLKNLVVQHMQKEMETSAKLAQHQLEDQTSQLALRDERLQEMEAVQFKLQATIESQRRREEKKEARKRQQKEPLETAYIMTNMPDDHQGPYKCGKTGGDAKKRAKEMQTGNHEEMRVVASAKCVDSKLIEDVMHRIFRDYRTNDKLEWFDSNLKSMYCVLKFVVRVIDGLNCVDHDEVCVDEALREAVGVLEEKIFRTSAQPETPIEVVQVATEPETVDFAGQFTSDETNPFAYFAEIAIDLDGRDDDFFTTKEALKVWKVLKKHRSHRAVLSKVPRESELIAYVRQHIPSEYFANAVIHYGGEPQLISGLFKGCSLRFSMLDARLIERVPEAYPSRIQDPIRTWLAESFQSTGEDKDRIGAREAWLMFKVDTKLDITENDFSSGMKDCGVSETRLKFGNVYKGLKRDIEDDD